MSISGQLDVHSGTIYTAVRLSTTWSSDAMKKYALFLLLTFSAAHAETYIDAEAIHADVKELIHKDKMIDPESFVMCASRDVMKFAYIGASPDGRSFNEIKNSLQTKYK